MGHPSSASWITEHSYALQALFPGPCAGWWHEEELIRLTWKTLYGQGCRAGALLLPSVQPRGLGKAEHWAASDTASKLCDCNEFQEAPYSGLNHLALLLPQSGFSVWSICSSAGLATWEIRTKICGAAILTRDSTRMAFWKCRKPVGSCPNRKILEASKVQTREKAYNYTARAEACSEGEVRPESSGKDVNPPPLNARPMGRWVSTAWIAAQRGGRRQDTYDCCPAGSPFPFYICTAFCWGRDSQEWFLPQHQRQTTLFFRNATTPGPAPSPAFPDTAVSSPYPGQEWRLAGFRSRESPHRPPHHSHNPPKAADIPPALQTSFPLAPTKLQQKQTIVTLCQTKPSQSQGAPWLPILPHSPHSSPLTPDSRGSTACCPAPRPPLPS